MRPRARSTLGTKAAVNGTMMLVPLSLVPLSLVPLSLVPLSLVPLSLVPLSLVPLSLVPLSLVPLSLVPLSLVPLSLVPLSLVPLSLLPLSPAPLSPGPRALVPELCPASPGRGGLSGARHWIAGDRFELPLAAQAMRAADLGHADAPRPGTLSAPRLSWRPRRRRQPRPCPPRP